MELLEKIVLKGLKISILSEYSLKAPFLTQIHFLPKNPFRKSMFPEKLRFRPKHPFLPNNPFRTSIFPKSLIFDPNVPFLPQNQFRKSIFSQSPIFKPKIPSEHQQPDSVPSTGQHFSNEEEKTGANMFFPPNMSLT